MIKVNYMVTFFSNGLVGGMPAYRNASYTGYKKTPANEEFYVKADKCLCLASLSCVPVVEKTEKDKRRTNNTGNIF